MGSVPSIMKSMVPTSLKNELRKIQDKSYSKVFATNVFTIGTNLLLNLSDDIDAFCIKKGKKEFDIPFSVKGTRFNLQIDKITQNQIKSGTYQLKAKKNNVLSNIQIDEDDVVLSGTQDDVSFALKVQQSQLYLEILSTKDSNLYLLNKNASMLTGIDIELSFVNNNFVGISLKNEINLQKLFFQNGFGKVIDVSFWKTKQDIIFSLENINNNSRDLNNEYFYLMGNVEDDGSINQIIFKINSENKTTNELRYHELDHIISNRLDIRNNSLAFISLENEVKPWKLLDTLSINDNKIFFKLEPENIGAISEVTYVVKKTGEQGELEFSIEENNLIIEGDSLSELPTGYVIDLYVRDNDDLQHRLIDRSQKKFVDIYRHYLLKNTESTKTYVYYTKTGRISIYKSISPIELVKADAETAYFKMNYANGKLSFTSKKQYEAILKVNDLLIEDLPVSYSDETNVIDLGDRKFIERHQYQILLKEQGNHNFNYVMADVDVDEQNTDLTFINKDLTFIPVSSLKLSIIVTFYNTQKYLDRLFSSLLCQGLAPSEYEVLAINDCSTDGSRQIAQKYANQYSQFKIIDHDTNKGLGEGRNTGVKEAKAPYLTFIDGDDFIRDNAYREMLDIITKTGSQLITGGVKRYRNNRVEISWMYRKVFIKTVEKTTLANHPELVYDLTAWNKIYNREWFIANGFKYPTMLYEDVPVTLPALNTAKSIDIYSEDMYYWFVRDQKGDESITNSRTDIKNFSDRMTAIRSGVAALEGNNTAKFEYEQKVLSMDIPMYLRHFNHVTDEYREALSYEIKWVLDNFMESAIKTLSGREIQRMILTANKDFENLLGLYEEGELAE